MQLPVHSMIAACTAPLTARWRESPAYHVRLPCTLNHGVLVACHKAEACLVASSGISLFRMAASPMMAGAERFFLMLMSFADISRAPATQASI